MLSEGNIQNSDVNTPKKACESHPDCFELKAYIQCDNGKCEDLILCNQAKVSHCEAQLFCSTSDRLLCELNKAKNLCELKMIIEIINGFLKSSAEKEMALAEIIKAVNTSELFDTNNNKCLTETT